MMSATQKLLRAARIRLHAGKLGGYFRSATVLLGSVALVGLITARLLGIIPGDWFSPRTLALIPAVALVAALVFHRRLPNSDVARQIDRRAGSKELFLSATLADQSPAIYRGIVVEQAEDQAKKLNVGRLLPFQLWPGLRDVAIVAALLSLAYWSLPQLDPFKVDARRQITNQQQKRLGETRKITALRAQELKEKTSALTEQVDAELAKLDKTLKAARPQERELNAKKLNEQAQNFSELWKNASNKLPQKASDMIEQASQKFGDAKHREAMQELISQLKQGDAKGLQQALEKLQKDLQAIANQPAGPDQKKEVEKIARELARMANQVRDQLGEKAVNEAMQRALEQMDMAQIKELAKDAMNGANDSLQLSKEELQRLAENFKDLKNIEDALKNLQAAKQLNEQGGLNGKDAQNAGADSLADYEALYQKLLAERGGDQPIGRGGGQNAQVGQGGSVGEDKNAKTAMKDEKSKTKMGAGRLLMQWKDEGVGEIGERSPDYEAAVKALKEGVAEAIRNEQVPPGYHSAIQKYFDRLPETPKK